MILSNVACNALSLASVSRVLLLSVGLDGIKS